ncbi:fluoride efflux transporter CrcB [Pseudooceanicola nanhaiensis]|uniref:fluoride efflux transporter CrcB n=1 Tax=Pseudooceanicola nanhaiensis TaxID=375761 RepID=UPI001CD20BB3|nr:fluoride efflux transporter CrcB [Pseudooceanicola nanhaiensis]MCA0922715.1 fluoride efflux transporter CrcB [Pseudooceanicola nanhaiensis]
MILTVLQVALGGAIGASCRYLLGVGVFRLVGPGFPLGVLTANIIGCGLMGMLVVFLGQKGLTHWNPFLATGILGGFTTFSSFSLEAWTMIERGQTSNAVLYVGLSLLLSFAALIGGAALMRSVLA